MLGNRGQRRLQLGQLAGGKLIGLVQHDQIRLFKLLFVDIEHAVGKTSRCVLFRRLPQPRQHAHLLHVDQYGKRGQIELLTVQLLERFDDGARQIGTTADRLADQHVNPRLANQAFHGADHVGKPATEAAADHFLDLGTAFLENLGIDQPRGLVIGDQADALALAGQALGGLRQEGGLAGSQKPTDEDQSGCVHGWLFMADGLRNEIMHSW